MDQMVNRILNLCLPFVSWCDVDIHARLKKNAFSVSFVPREDCRDICCR